MSEAMSVTKTVMVPADAGKAFDVFVARMGKWWPKSHSILQNEVQDVVVELKPQGRWYEHDGQGNEADWGYVKSFERGDHLLLCWQLTADWARDEALDTEVYVIFENKGDMTEVKLTHRLLENYGDRAAEMKAAFEAPNAWADMMISFAERFDALAA